MSLYGLTRIINRSGSRFSWRRAGERNTDGERSSALPRWAAAGLTSALLATAATNALAQNIEDEDLLLRGIVAGEDVATAEDRDDALRDAETVDADEADREEITETRLVTGAVPAVQSPGAMNERQSTVDDHCNLVFDPKLFGPVGIRIGICTPAKPGL